MKYSERPAEDGCLLVPPSGAVAGRTKASDREVTTGKNFKHPMALGGVQRLTAQYRYVGWRENKGKSERGRGKGEGGGETGRGRTEGEERIGADVSEATKQRLIDLQIQSPFFLSLQRTELVFSALPR